jgi:hypothetical protein
VEAVAGCYVPTSREALVSGRERLPSKGGAEDMDVKMRQAKDPDPNKYAVFEVTGNPAIRGEGGSLNYTCSSCTSVLIEKVFSEQVADVVVKCAKCGTYNEMPPASHHAD